MSLNDRLFFHGSLNGVNHVYDREKPAEQFRGEWYTSLCGQSWCPEKKAKSFSANRDGIQCGTCQRIIKSMEAAA